jgi:hypothetical protein
MSMTLEDSTSYQFILNKGRTEEAKQNLLRLGSQKFGSPPAGVEAAIKDINYRLLLEMITDRLLKAVTWEELLATA